MVEDKKKFARQGVLFAIDPVINLATVNYLLHGLQRYGYNKDETDWHTLWVALGIDEYFGQDMKNEMTEADEELMKNEIENSGKTGNAIQMRILRRRLVDYLVKNVIKPFGVPRGSEKQGGQHQGGCTDTFTFWCMKIGLNITI